MEKFINRIDAKLVSNKKCNLKWTSKPSYMSNIIFDHNLLTICITKVTLMLNKSAYIGMCILELSKVLMYEFNYDGIKNNYVSNSRPLFTDTDSSMYEIKTEDAYEDFTNDKEMVDFSNYSSKNGMIIQAN